MKSLYFSFFVFLFITGCSSRPTMNSVDMTVYSLHRAKMEVCKKFDDSASYVKYELGTLVEYFEYNEKAYNIEYKKHLASNQLIDRVECDKSVSHADNYAKEMKRTLNDFALIKYERTQKLNNFAAGMKVILQGLSQGADSVQNSYNQSSNNVPSVQPVNYLFTNQNDTGCINDYQCSGALKCVKAPMAQRGQCVQPVTNYGSPLNTIPRPSSVQPNTNPHGQCLNNAQCPTGFICDQSLKVCLKRNNDY